MIDPSSIAMMSAADQRLNRPLTPAFANIGFISDTTASANASLTADQKLFDDTAFFRTSNVPPLIATDASGGSASALSDSLIIVSHTQPSITHSNDHKSSHRNHNHHNNSNGGGGNNGWSHHTFQSTLNLSIGDKLASSPHHSSEAEENAALDVERRKEIDDTC